MTFLVFFLGVVLGYILFPNMSVFGQSYYVIFYITTLSCACALSILSKDKRNVCCALILIANFFMSHYAWQLDQVYLFQCMIDMLTSLCFYLLRAWGFSFIFSLSSFVGFLVYNGLVCSSQERDLIFIAFSYPDILAILGHSASIFLGYKSGDFGGGKFIFRIRLPFVVAISDCYRRFDILQIFHIYKTKSINMVKKERVKNES